MAVAHAEHVAAKAARLNLRSLAFILLAGALLGSGLFTVMVWILLLPGAWLWSLGLAPVTLGAVLLFLPQSGPDSS